MPGDESWLFVRSLTPFEDGRRARPAPGPGGGDSISVEEVRRVPRPMGILGSSSSRLVSV